MRGRMKKPKVAWKDKHEKDERAYTKANTMKVPADSYWTPSDWVQDWVEGFRQLFNDTTQIAVQGYDSERRVVYWNQASEVVYEYSAEEAMGKRIEDLIIPTNLHQHVIDSIERWINHGKPVPAAGVTLRRKDGKPVHVFSSHVLLSNRQGEPEMYCIDIDVTERLATEQALKDSEARFRLLAENMSDLVCLHSPTGCFEYVSPSSLALLGYKSHELIGQMPASFCHADDYARLMNMFENPAQIKEPLIYRMRDFKRGVPLDVVIDAPNI